MSWRFFDCTADLVGQLNGNGQKGMLQIDALPLENFCLRHCYGPAFVCLSVGEVWLLGLGGG